MNVLIQDDNAGALVLAEILPPHFTPRRKHYASKTIWFREEIVKPVIKLLKIDTVEKLGGGGGLMKGLPHITSGYLQKKLVGW